MRTLLEKSTPFLSPSYNWMQLQVKKLEISSLEKLISLRHKSRHPDKMVENGQIPVPSPHHHAAYQLSHMIYTRLLSVFYVPHS